MQDDEGICWDMATVEGGGNDDNGDGNSGDGSIQVIHTYECLQVHNRSGSSKIKYRPWMTVQNSNTFTLSF